MTKIAGALAWLMLMVGQTVAQSNPFFLQDSDPQRWFFVASKQVHAGESGVFVEGVVRTVTRDLVKKTESSVEQKFDANCAPGRAAVGRTKIDPKKAVRPTDRDAPQYALWREVCSEYLDPIYAPKTLVCVTPVPRVLRQLGKEGAQADAEARGKIVGNVNYLVGRYCRVAAEPLVAEQNEDLGEGCQMHWGHLRGYPVYWGECKAAEPPASRAQSQLSCCLQYYAGEKSLEGWGPAERCRRNMASIKANWCALLRQEQRQRRTGAGCDVMISAYRKMLASGEMDYDSDAARYMRRQCRIR